MGTLDAARAPGCWGLGAQRFARGQLLLARAASGAPWRWNRNGRGLSERSAGRLGVKRIAGYMDVLRAWGAVRRW